MSRSVTLSLLIFSAFLYSASSASAQAAAPGAKRVVTATRLVALFTELEQQWLTAMQHRDKAALNKMLSDEFEQWMPTPPGAPLPREEWLHDILTTFTLRSFHIRQVAVRMVGETAVVSFVQRQHAECNGQDCSGESFIVDLWQRQGDTWQVAVRYTARISNLPQPEATHPSGKH